MIVIAAKEPSFCDRHIRADPADHEIQRILNSVETTEDNVIPSTPDSLALSLPSLGFVVFFVFFSFPFGQVPVTEEQMEAAY